MKSFLRIITVLLITLTFTSCSSIKVLNAWKSDKAETIRDKKVLVIARASRQQARVAFEEAIAKKMRAAGMDATESYQEIREMDPNKKISEKEMAETRSRLEAKGYNAIVITMVKDKSLEVQRNVQGGYYAGATMPGYYPMYYSGFYGYYAHPSSYMYYGGNYVPETITSQTSTTYVLETLVYNLDLPEDQQLLAEVTSSIEDPSSAYETAQAYANKVTAALKKQ